MADGLIAIPAYNEEENLGGVLDRIRAAGGSEDVLVIDDGSRDGTAKVAEAHGAAVERHVQNRGYARALETGIRVALERDYGYLVFIDADGQHDPRYIADLHACAFSESSSAPDIV